MRAPVLHVAPFLWSGAGGVIARLCEAQRRQGPVVVVTTGRSDGMSDWPSYRRRLRRAGVTHHTIDFFHRDSEIFWTSASALAALIDDLKPGVIHAHAGVPTSGAVVARAMSGHRARVIGQMYSWGPDRPAWMDRQDAWGLGQSDRVVCSARAYWDLLVSHGVPARKLTYLPWGLPLDELPWRDASSATRGRARPVIGFVGRLESRKGQLPLVEAFARIRDVHPMARLELVGPVADEDYAGRIRAAIARHGLEDSVTLTGKVRDVASRVATWDVFVSLSADEGQGLAVLEAMAIGVPVAARPVAGIADFLVDGRTGFAIDGSSPRAAAEVLTLMLSQPAKMRAVTVRARRLVERRYAWPRTVQAFERLYGH
jgi:glycosyltransferase involved in cell wall biosynthesis